MSILLHPVEHAIFARYLGVENPTGLDDAELREDPHSAGAFIGLRPNAWGEDSRHALANAVARFALDAIQEQLPKWDVSRAGHRVTLGRQVTRPVPRIVYLAPRFLLEVDLCRSEPAEPWPEAYHLTYLPVFDHYVVTMSQDSPDMWGYTDLAIAHFAKAEPLKQQLHRAITGWWTTAYRRNFIDRPAVCFSRAGYLTQDDFVAWRADVWPAAAQGGCVAPECRTGPGPAPGDLTGR